MTSSRSSRWTLGIVSVGLFMVVLDNLVVNVALPSIHRDLGASIQALEWTVNAYVLAYAVFLLTGAALGDRFGRRRLFAAGIGLFTLSSSGLFGVVFGLVRSTSQGWTNPEILTALTVGVLLLAAFVAHERRVADPMLPLTFFGRRSFAVTNAVSLSMYFGMFGSIFFLSQYLQNVLHNSPLQAGVKLLVWTGAVMVVSPLAGFFSERLGSRWFMAAGLSLQALALGLLAMLASVDQSYASMIVPFVLAGSGMALVFAP